LNRAVQLLLQSFEFLHLRPGLRLALRDGVGQPLASLIQLLLHQGLPPRPGVLRVLQHLVDVRDRVVHIVVHVRPHRRGVVNLVLKPPEEVLQLPDVRLLYRVLRHLLLQVTPFHLQLREPTNCACLHLFGDFFDLVDELVERVRIGEPFNDGLEDHIYDELFKLIQLK